MTNKQKGGVMVVVAFEAIMVFLSLLAMGREPKFPFWIELVAHNVFFLFLIGFVLMFFRGLDKWEDG